MRSLLLACVVGCGPAVEPPLAELGNPDLNIWIDPTADGTPWLGAELIYSGGHCAPLDVEATFDGVPFDKVSEGGKVGAHSCDGTVFIMDTFPAQAGTIRIADASGSIAVTIPELAADAIDFASPLATIRANDTLRFATTAAVSDVITFSWIRATTPAADVRSPSGTTVCGSPLFDGQLAGTSDGFSFVVRDVYADWQHTECDYVLTRGQPVPADIELRIAVELEDVHCEGLQRCAAYLDARYAHALTFVP